MCFEQKYEQYQSFVVFLSENIQFLEVKFSIYLNRRDFVMGNFVQDNFCDIMFDFLKMKPRLKKGVYFKRKKMLPYRGANSFFFGVDPFSEGRQKVLTESHFLQRMSVVYTWHAYDQNELISNRFRRTCNRPEDLSFTWGYPSSNLANKSVYNFSLYVYFKLLSAPRNTCNSAKVRFNLYDQAPVCVSFTT